MAELSLVQWCPWISLVSGACGDDIGGALVACPRLGVSGPIAGAIVSELGYPPIFLFAAVMSAVAGGLLIVLWKRSL